MKPFLTCVIFSVATLLLSSRTFAGPPATQPAPLPTVAELQQMHDAGDYRTCLQQIARLLALRGEPAKRYDAYSLLLLRGDCLLHLEDRITALSAYQSAAKAPMPRLPAEARAMALLIESSTGLAYQPKFPADAPAIDIVDHQKRKTALLALLDQKRLDDKALVAAAVDAQTLAPIIKAAPDLLDQYSLELTATGADTQIHPTLAAIGEKARELISRELDVVDQRITLVETKANQPINVGVGGFWWSATARQGLTSADRDALRSDGTYADQIVNATVEFQHISRQLGKTGEKWDPLVNRSMEVSGHANAVLMAE